MSGLTDSFLKRIDLPVTVSYFIKEGTLNVYQSHFFNKKMYVDYQLISIMFSHYILNIRKYKCMHITYSTLIGTLIDRWLYNWYRLVYFPFHQDKRKKNKNHEREK